MPAVPAIQALQPIMMDEGALVYLKSDVDARDATVARFLVNIRGAWFDCANQLQKVADYYEAAGE
ncbi:MAG: hypothetical protein AAGB23_05145 [Pseudomonadota bacterium]